MNDGSWYSCISHTHTNTHTHLKIDNIIIRRKKNLMYVRMVNVNNNNNNNGENKKKTEWKAVGRENKTVKLDRKWNPKNKFKWIQKKKQ